MQRYRCVRNANSRVSKGALGSLEGLLMPVLPPPVLQRVCPIKRRSFAITESPADVFEMFVIKFFPFFRKCTKRLDRFSVFFSHESNRRRSLMVKHQPSKLVLSVRFRPPAPAEHRRLSGLTIGMKAVRMRFFLSISVKNGLTNGMRRLPIEVVGFVDC